MAFNDRVRSKRAFVNVSTSGSNLILSGVTGKIKVLGLVIISASANTVYFTSNTTAISSSFALAANGGFTLPISPDAPWLETAAGEDLKIVLSASAQVGITLVYEVNNV